MKKNHKGAKSYVMRGIFSVLICFVLLALCFMSGKGEEAQAAGQAEIQIGEYTIREGEKYSFKNVSSGWYINTKHKGSINGTEINLWPFDYEDPCTQLYVIHIVDADKKIVTISPDYATAKSFNVRRNGKPFAVGQGICLWTPDEEANFIIDVQEDGSIYLAFALYPDYCIGAKSAKAAETKMVQLTVCKKENQPERRWIICNEKGESLQDISKVRKAMELLDKLDSTKDGSETRKVRELITNAETNLVKDGYATTVDLAVLYAENLVEFYNNIKNFEGTREEFEPIMQAIETYKVLMPQQFEAACQATSKKKYSALNEGLKKLKDMIPLTVVDEIVEIAKSQMGRFKAELDERVVKYKNLNGTDSDKEAVYYVVPNAAIAETKNADDTRIFDQTKYDFWRYDPTVNRNRNVGCTTVAVAICYSITNNTILKPDDASIKGTWSPSIENRKSYSANWSKTYVIAEGGMSMKTWQDTIYDYINQGKPVIITVTGHTVVAIGYRDSVASSADISMSTLLVADPYGGEIRPLDNLIELELGKYNIDLSCPLRTTKE